MDKTGGKNGFGAVDVLSVVDPKWKVLGVSGTGVVRLCGWVAAG